MSGRIEVRGLTACLAVALFVGWAGCGSNTQKDPGGEGDPGVVADDAGTPDAGEPDAGIAAVVPRIQFTNLYPAVSVSSDGKTAVLQDQFSANNDVYFYDVATGTAVKKTETGVERYVNGMSGDGSRIVGSRGDETEVAAVWSEAKGWVDIPSPFPEGCAPSTGAGWALNGDGSVAVGMLWNGCDDVVAFRWSDASGEGVLTQLEKIGGGGVNRATVVSDDGKVAGGFAWIKDGANRSPAIWREDGTGLLLDTTGEAFYGEVLSISDDGKTVAGVWNNEGFYWTEETGVVKIGGFLDASGQVELTLPSAIAAGGKLIFGGSGHRVFSVQHAFVWDEAHGMRSLEDIAKANGLVMRDGFILSEVMGASSDGTVLVGFASNPTTGEWISFVLELPLSAYGL